MKFRSINKHVIILYTSLLVGVFASAAKGAVLTFDDITNDSGLSVIPEGYGGFSWEKATASGATAFRISNITSILGDPSYANTGYLNSLVSSDFVAFNNNGNPAWVSSINGLFNFVGAYFTAAIRDGLNITVNGYLNNQLLFSSTAIVETTTPKWVAFGYYGINELEFISFGGSLAPGVPFPSSTDPRPHFAMDNFNFEVVSIPAPGTLALFGMGLAGLGFSRRNKS